MKEENLVQRLEKLIRENPKMIRNGNWGSDRDGAHGHYKMYIIVFDDRNKSTEWIIVKEYKNGRPKGKYSVMTNLTKGDYDSNDIDSIINRINQDYEAETQHL